jgi:hypothetical protein
MPNNNDNYLITGYWGEPHVTAENDRGIHASMFGAGRFVLPVGKQFEATYIGNNTIRMYDGKLIDNGAIAGIPAGECVDFRLPTAGSGMKRNDLIVFEYKKDDSTNRESGTFTVLSGTETSGTPVDPLLTYSEDLLAGNAWRDQIALWRVTVEGTNIGAPVRLAPVVWDNPPMEVGVEYATAEFFNGKRVYIKSISAGAMPNANATKNQEHGVESMGYIVDFGGVMTSTGGGAISLPYYFSSDNWARLSVTSDNFVIVSGSNNLSSYNDVRLWVKYTKTKD